MPPVACLPLILQSPRSDSWLIWSPEIVVRSPRVSFYQLFSSALYEVAGHWSIHFWLSVCVFHAPEIIHVQQSIPINIIVFSVVAVKILFGSYFVTFSQQTAELQATSSARALIYLLSSALTLFIHLISFFFLSVVPSPLKEYDACVALCVCVSLRAASALVNVQLCVIPLCLSLCT